MAKYTQAGRPLALTTPLGTDILLLESFEGTETISAPFRFQLDLLAETATPIAFDGLLGQAVTISLTLPDGSVRPINGVVSELSQGGKVLQSGTTGFIRYRAEVVPALALLARNYQSRTFQQQTVPDILTAVLTGLTIDNQIQGTFDPRDYCVQYRESDLAFASRLMEEEGIYYYFTHTTSAHTMVLANTPQGNVDVTGATTAIYDVIEGGYQTDDRITAWEKTQVIRSGKATLRDACFELPGQNLEAAQPVTASVAVGTITHKLNVGNSALEIYEYPGGYAQRYDGVAPGGGDQASNVSKIFTDNARTAGIRMQQETTPALVIRGQSQCRQFQSGCKFTLDRHFDANGSYVLTEVNHRATLGGAYITGDGDFRYENTFRCIPAALPYRPSRVTPRPRIEGPQTAVVVGPQGQEIFTDKYSRVKVQFPWDRLGKNDANSSCWIRVASSWAGKQWGFIQIPRIGQEVVVSFEDGDPDRPIITGSVYNAEMMPPFTLPANATQSGSTTRSSAQGTAENANSLVFEDKKGSELVTFHAEKDYTRVVENNDTLTIGVDGSQSLADGSQTITIYKDRTATLTTGNETLTVKKGNRAVEVSEGNDSLKVAKGNRTVEVSEGNDSYTVTKGTRTVSVFGDDSYTVKSGDRTVEVTKGGDTLTIKVGDQTVSIKAGASTTEATKGITLKVGGSSIKIEPAAIILTAGPSSIKLEAQGVTIAGPNVKAQANIQAQVQGAICQINGSGMLKMAGGITMIG